jgi:transcriptional regulator with GAF, ATPase, and Fis domain
VTELLAVVGDSHSPRALVRAVAATLATRLPITRVELRPPAPAAVAEFVDGEWRCLDSVATDRRAREIAPGLAVTSRGPLPTSLADAELRDALGQVIAAASRHLDVIQRVATVSRSAHVENRALRSDLARFEPRGAIVARSAAMRAAWTRAELVARHPTTVLLVGESGSGKEVMAREIHRLSPRAHRPFIQLNCGAIPQALVESELFGHERGAFTGAERRHVGAFERAHRGTLLLDEVGELPLASQVKLLRVLQERQIRRVGAESQVAIDVRLVAATNRSIATMVDDKTFREDLYYRLDVFSIAVPSLRERRGDIGPLVAQLVGELADKLGMATPAIPRRVLTRLEAYDWPGNVRELMNVLETAMILGGDTLDLPDAFAKRRPSEPGGKLDSAVRIAIENALRTSRGKIYGADGAAEKLGLKPGTLQSKMKKLAIERKRFT